jgi:hypothetical protein
LMPNLFNIMVLNNLRASQFEAAGAEPKICSRLRHNHNHV